MRIASLPSWSLMTALDGRQFVRYHLSREWRTSHQRLVPPLSISTITTTKIFSTTLCMYVVEKGNNGRCATMIVVNHHILVLIASRLWLHAAAVHNVSVWTELRKWLAGHLFQLDLIFRSNHFIKYVLVAHAELKITADPWPAIIHRCDWPIKLCMVVFALTEPRQDSLEGVQSRSKATQLYKMAQTSLCGQLH